ncbi:hypothetical protein INQ41_07845 [Lysobacter ciconiae]|uniref:Uncharacterized protein n=1 Tax=Novilysobacter ciconiae TaxID=2781022 RepID=A0A7S6UE53_9GAMM|nr:hypothetical protein [Lysobacter ciconiae]QOW18622.1 hypothetical protein INQ41_07845 [Lysobacter ciconiae]
MFHDEGFGSLDPDSLDVALDALDSLNAQGKLIGVISDVDAGGARRGGWGHKAVVCQWLWSCCEGSWLRSK